MANEGENALISQPQTVGWEENEGLGSSSQSVCDTVSSPCSILSSVTSTREYFDDEESGTFGIMKKGEYFPNSDFQFNMVAEVICSMPANSGYLVQLDPCRSGERRNCYFTADSTNKKSEFMKCLNSSYKLRCLQCSFSDKQLAEYIQYKKKSTIILPRKFCVSQVGLQTDSATWVLNENVHLGKDGNLIKSEDQQFVWLGDMYSGAGIARESEACSITLPLSTDPMRRLVCWLKTCMKHNFVPSLMTVASTILVLHYKLLLEHLRFCPIPLSFGASGTGKTTALCSGLSLLGAHESRFFSKLTNSKILDLCSSSCIPLGVDDPQSKGDFSRLLIDLYNGARSATVSHGSRKPSSSCVISANFASDDQERYASRCLMIKFSLPPLSMTLSQYMEGVQIWKECGKCVGFCVSLGSKFMLEGIQEVDDTIVPALSCSIGDVSPRVIPSYGILYWFTQQILVETGLSERLKTEVDEHFYTNVLKTAAIYQVKGKEVDESTTKNADEDFDFEDFAEQVLSGIEDVTPPKVVTFFRTNTFFQHQPAYCMLLNRIPGVSHKMKVGLKNYLKKHEDKGVCNTPRHFSNEDLASKGIIPQEYAKNFKPMKCTVLLSSLFSKDKQMKFNAATGENKDSCKSKKTPVVGKNSDIVTPNSEDMEESVSDSGEPSALHEESPLVEMNDLAGYCKPSKDIRMMEESVCLEKQESPVVELNNVTEHSINSRDIEDNMMEECVDSRKGYAKHSMKKPETTTEYKRRTRSQGAVANFSKKLCTGNSVFD